MTVTGQDTRDPLEETLPREKANARCCDEPECRRHYPISLYLADFSDRVFAVTARRVVREHGDGSATFAATGRHDVTAQMREFIRRNPEWVRAVLDAEEVPAS